MKRFLLYAFTCCLLTYLVLHHQVAVALDDDPSKIFAQKVLKLALADSASIHEQVLVAEAAQVLSQANSLNKVALEVLNQGHYDQAKVVFRMNATLFPETKPLGQVMLAIAGLDQTTSIHQLEEFFNQCYQCMPTSEYLNSFGYKLLSFKEPQKALVAFRLNTMLFPEEAESWLAYAEGLLANQAFDKAAFYYEKTREMDTAQFAKLVEPKLQLLDRLREPQQVNRELVAKNGRVSLIGAITKQAFDLENYRTWFQSEYSAYQLDEKASQKMKQENLGDIQVKAFFGSWCGDSRRELPRFYKMADQIGLTPAQLAVFAVNNDLEAYKQSDGREEKGLNVFRVPTFIVYKNGEEIGRIIESPITRLEEDFSKIISNERYTPKYSGAMALEKVLNEKGSRYIKKHTTQIAQNLEAQTERGSEIYSYALTKYANKEYDLALAILKINQELFPNYSGNPLRMGQIYVKMGKTEKAIPLLEAYLKQYPKSASVRTLIWNLKREKS
ncbi:MAG: tetratricopeptide repeat protein [Flammeovirgaceae bacterium]